MHEKLDCYRLAIECAGGFGKEMSRWPRGYGFLADQLKRAMASVVLNIAEGNAKQSKPERRRFFRISRASAVEVAACVDLMRAYILISADGAGEFKLKIDRISRMLYHLM